MGYIKAVISGTNLELYTYERDIIDLGGKKPNSKGRVRMQGVSDVGGISVERKAEKRKDNVARAALCFRRLVNANLAQSLPPILVTLTYSENQTDLRIGYKDFNAFVRNLRKLFGVSFSYICAPEFQRRGAVHFHALVWGLPSHISEEERRTRVVQRCWAKGFVDVYQTDGDERISSYLSKYMVKSYADSRLVGFKAYRCSRNVKRPVFEKKLGGLWYLQERYGIGVDNLPSVDKQFMTRWLGKGRYRHYKIIPR